MFSHLDSDEDFMGDLEESEVRSWDIFLNLDYDFWDLSSFSGAYNYVSVLLWTFMLAFIENKCYPSYLIVILLFLYSILSKLGNLDSQYLFLYFTQKIRMNGMKKSPLHQKWT